MLSVLRVESLIIYQGDRTNQNINIHQDAQIYISYLLQQQTFCMFKFVNKKFVRKCFAFHLEITFKQNALGRKPVLIFKVLYSLQLNDKTNFCVNVRRYYAPDTEIVRNLLESWHNSLLLIRIQYKVDQSGPYKKRVMLMKQQKGSFPSSYCGS